MIKELTHEEAARLRELVKNRFIQSPFNGAGFKISQHLPSYCPLADDIVRVVPDAKAWRRAGSTQHDIRYELAKGVAIRIVMEKGWKA